MHKRLPTPSFLDLLVLPPSRCVASPRPTSPSMSFTPVRSPVISPSESEAQRCAWTRERASPSIGHDVFLPLRCECDTLTCNRQPAGTESHEAPSPHLVCSTTHRHLCPTGNVSTGAIPIPNQQVPSRCLYSTVYSISIHELQIESVLHWFSD